jgi:hypothetical protein
VHVNALYSDYMWCRIYDFEDQTVLQSFAYFVAARKNIGFFKAVHISASWGYLCYFHYVLNVSVGVSRV